MKILKVMKLTIAFLFPLLVTAGAFSACKPGGEGKVTSDEDVTTAGEQVKNPPESAQDLDISKYYILSSEEYTDKTTAGLLGQFAGFFSGYEFVWNEDKTPRIALPDSWYSLIRGPYAGNNTYQFHTNRLILNPSTGIWEVYSDDDFHIDILNQYILKSSFDKHDAVSASSILENWLYYQVSDWGGGSQEVGAMKLMTSLNLLPPFTGRSEYGNICHWLTEPYIENETLGMNAAGLPNAAVDLTSVFANVTGDYENVMWAKFYAAMYAMAYFEDDVNTLIGEAKKVFPEGAFPLEIIDMCYTAYEKYPDDWRAAVIEIEEKVWRDKFGMTGQTDSGTNGAFAVLALLYGGGDYKETCKIASLAGYDGDCTAAIVTGIVGIIGGTENTPREVKLRIWRDGDGVYVNDAQGDWPARLRANFPERTKFSEIIDLYRQNFEVILQKNGGYIFDGIYYIPKSTLKSTEGIAVVNGDFESGTYDNFTYITEDDKAKIMVTKSAAVTGEYGVKISGQGTHGTELYTVCSGLKAGELYSLSAYISTSAKVKAILFARGDNGECQSSSVYSQSAFARRELVFRATGETMYIGVMRPAGKAVTGYFTADDFLLYRIEEKQIAEIIFFGNNSEEHEIDGKKGLLCYGVVEGSVSCPKTGEYLLKISFANSNLATVYADISINGDMRGTAPFYKTGSSIEGFSENDFVYIPVTLREGTNTISIDIADNTVIFKSEIVLRSDTFEE